MFWPTHPQTPPLEKLFLQCQDIVLSFGISRSKIYELMELRSHLTSTRPFQSQFALAPLNEELLAGGIDLPPPAIPISWREVQGFAG